MNQNHKSSSSLQTPEKLLVPRPGVRVGADMLEVVKNGQKTSYDSAYYQSAEALAYQKLLKEQFKKENPPSSLPHTPRAANARSPGAFQAVQTVDKLLPGTRQARVGQAYVPPELASTPKILPVKKQALWVAGVVGVIGLLVLAFPLNMWLKFFILFNLSCFMIGSLKSWLKNQEENKEPLTESEKNTSTPEQSRPLSHKLSPQFMGDFNLASWNHEKKVALNSSYLSALAQELLKNIDTEFLKILSSKASLPEHHTPEHYYLKSTLENDLPNILNSVLSGIELLDEATRQEHEKELNLTLQDVLQKLQEIKASQIKRQSNSLKAKFGHMRHKAKQ